jgi:hypothetical protein
MMKEEQRLAKVYDHLKDLCQSEMATSITLIRTQTQVSSSNEAVASSSLIENRMGDVISGAMRQAFTDQIQDVRRHDKGSSAGTPTFPLWLTVYYSTSGSHSDQGVAASYYHDAG